MVTPQLAEYPQVTPLTYDAHLCFLPVLQRCASGDNASVGGVDGARRCPHAVLRSVLRQRAAAAGSDQDVRLSLHLLCHTHHLHRPLLHVSTGCCQALGMGFPFHSIIFLVPMQCMSNSGCLLLGKANSHSTALPSCCFSSVQCFRVSIIPWEIRVAFPKETTQSRATQP